MRIGKINIDHHKNFLTKIRLPLPLILLPLFFLLFFVAPTFAQKGEIKKSTKIETVDGKKYYDHTVEKGQTLYAIAKAYNLSVNDILLENPDALNGIKPGQVLKIPFEKPVPVVKNTPNDTSTFIIHKVESGETIYSLAKKYSVPQDAILKLNPDAKNGLKLGENLKIPKNASSFGGNAVLNNSVASDTLYAGHKKSIYNVAMMLPLQLWNVDNLDPDCIVKEDKDSKCEFPAKAKAAVAFYEGALLALDSMRRAGMKVNLHVYDVDDGDSTKVSTILSKPEFISMDLILGPLSPGPFYTVSNWAKDHHVAIVSPVSPANKVLFKHPDAMKALPSLSTQMDQLAVFIGENHKNDNVIVITNANPKEQVIANEFRINVSKIIFPGTPDTVKMVHGMTGLESQLKKDKPNILIIPSNSETYVSDLLRSLNTLSDKYIFVVYGLPSWMGFENLDPEYLEKLQFHFVAPYFIDYDSSATTKRFLNSYYNAFKGDPDQYAFAGYDVTLFFLQALNNYGTDFYQKLSQLKGAGLQQPFDFFRSDAESGYENRGIQIVEVADYKLVKVK